MQKFSGFPANTCGYSIEMCNVHGNAKNPDPCICHLYRHGNYSKTVRCGLKVLVVIDAYYRAKRENKILLTEINYVGLN